MHADASEHEALSSACRAPELLRALRHEECIAIEPLQEVVGSRWVRAPFVREFLRDEARPGALSLREVLRLAEDTLGMGTAMQVADALRIVLAVPTVDLLRQLHDRWLERFQRTHDDRLVRSIVKQLGGSGLARAPLPATANIVPVLNVQELFEEGRQMHHCVSTRASECARGESFVFRVLAPQRATVEVRISDGPCAIWDIWEMQGVCNSPVSDECWEAVEAWLDAAAPVRFEDDADDQD